MNSPDVEKYKNLRPEVKNFLAKLWGMQINDQVEDRLHYLCLTYLPSRGARSKPVLPGDLFVWETYGIAEVFKVISEQEAEAIASALPILPHGSKVVVPSNYVEYGTPDADERVQVIFAEAPHDEENHSQDDLVLTEAQVSVVRETIRQAARLYKAKYANQPTLDLAQPLSFYESLLESLSFSPPKEVDEVPVEKDLSRILLLAIQDALGTELWQSAKIHLNLRPA